MRTTTVTLGVVAALALPIAASGSGRPAADRRQVEACPVTVSQLPLRRHGTRTLWVWLPAGGTLHVRRNRFADGLYGTKLGWIPDRDRGLTLSVSGRRLDASGRMRVHGVSWGYSSSGKGSWASAVDFPAGGCWRITGRAGAATVSYVVRVVPAP